jgi:hypothetical protein
VFFILFSKNNSTNAPPPSASANANNANDDDDDNDLNASIADADDIGYSSSDGDDDEEDDDEVKADSSSTDADLADDEKTDNESSTDEDDTDFNSNMYLTEDTLLIVFQVVIRIRAFIRFIRRSSLLRELFKKESREKKLPGDGLILDVRVRWNSSYYMLHRFIKYEDIISRITMNPRVFTSITENSLVCHLKGFMLSHEEWGYVIATRDVLSTFEEACRLICGRRYQTLSVGYIVLVGLDYHLSKTDGVQNKIQIILNKSLRNAYDYHVSDKIDYEQKYAMLVSDFLPFVDHVGRSQTQMNIYYIAAVLLDLDRSEMRLM